MAPKKVTLQYIKNRVARRAAFRKRRVGLLKKMEEISVLCGIKGLAIIYNPEEQVPVVWPSIELAHQRLREYWHKPELDRCKRMMDHETFLHEQIKKIEEQLLKQQKINSEAEMNLLMHQIYKEGKPLSNFDYEKLMNLLRYADKNWKEVSKKVAQIESLANVSSHDSEEMDEISSWLQMIDKHVTAPKQTLQEQWFLESPRNDDQENNIMVNCANSSISQQPMHLFLRNFSTGASVNDMVIPQRFFEGNNSIGGNMGFLYGSSSGGNKIPESEFYLRNLGRTGLSEGNFGSIGTSDDMVLPYDNNLGDNNTNGTNIRTRLPYGDFGGPMIDNNIGLRIHQRTFGGSNNGISVRTFDSNHNH